MTGASMPSKPTGDASDASEALLPAAFLETGPTQEEPSIFRIKKSCKAAIQRRGDCMSHFSDLAVIGSGNFATVQRSIHTQTQRPVVLKTLFKSTSLQRAGFVKRERWCLENVRHPNIIRTVDVVVNEVGGSSFKKADGSIVLVQECANAGDLFDFVEKSSCNICETQTKSLIEQLLQAMFHLHLSGIAHLDVKIENILLHREANSSHLQLKLADFGLSRVSDLGDDIDAVTERNGTIEYMAPEMHEKTKSFGGKQADMWAVGICLFVMLTGFPPMTIAKSSCPWFLLISRRRFDLYWEKVDRILKQNGRKVPSFFAKDLVNRLLTANPSSRLTAEEALRHPFCRQSSPNVHAIIQRLSNAQSRLSFQTIAKRWFVKYHQSKALELCSNVTRLASNRKKAAAFCRWKSYTEAPTRSLRVRVFSGPLLVLIIKANLHRAMAKCWKAGYQQQKVGQNEEFTKIVQSIFLFCALLRWSQSRQL